MQICHEDVAQGRMSGLQVNSQHTGEQPETRKRIKKSTAEVRDGAPTALVQKVDAEGSAARRITPRAEGVSTYRYNYSRFLRAGR